MSRVAPSTGRDRADQSGFAVLELIVALALLAAALAMLPTAFGMAGRTLSAEAELGAWSDQAAARRYLARVVSQAMPLVTRRQDGRLGIAFSGNPDSMTFLAAVPHGPAGAGIYRHVLTVERAAGTASLILELSLHTPAIEGGGAPLLRRRLTTGPGLRLRYFGTDWSETWQRLDRLPDLIEVTLPGPAGGEGLPLIVKTRLAGAG